MFSNDDYDFEYEQEERQPQPNPIAQWYGQRRLVHRFGMLVAGGLSASLLARIIPVLLPTYALIQVGVVVVGVLVAALSRNPAHKLSALFIMTFISLGSIGGWWDGVLLFFQSKANQDVTMQVGLLAGVGMLGLALEGQIREAMKNG